MDQKTDLSLVPSDELFEELAKRFDVWIFSGLQIIDSKLKIATSRKWRGNSATCAGLASQLQIAIYENYLKGELSGDELPEM